MHDLTGSVRLRPRSRPSARARTLPFKPPPHTTSTCLPWIVSNDALLGRDETQETVCPCACPHAPHFYICAALALRKITKPHTHTITFTFACSAPPPEQPSNPPAPIPLLPSVLDTLNSPQTLVDHHSDTETKAGADPSVAMQAEHSARKDGVGALLADGDERHVKEIAHSTPMETSAMAASALRDELATMRIKTLYNMIHEKEVRFKGGASSTQKILWLTNKQVMMFKKDRMGSLLTALEIESPPPIIFFIRSTEDTSTEQANGCNKVEWGENAQNYFVLEKNGSHTVVTSSNMEDVITPFVRVQKIHHQ